MDEPLEWFRSLPPLTRTWFGLTLVLTGSVALDIIPASQLIFDWDRIRLDSEVWRLASPFCFADGPITNFSTLILLYLVYNFSLGYERNPYDTGGGGGSADYALALVVCASLTLLTYRPVVLLFGPTLLGSLYSSSQHYRPPILYPLFTRNLAYSVLYLWSRRNPRARVDINFIPVVGRYVPFAHVGISLFLGHRVGQMAHGIFVGHVYYWLVDVVPRMYGGRMILKTPELLIDYFRDEGERGEWEAEMVDVGDVGEDGELPPLPPPHPPGETVPRVLPPPTGLEGRDSGGAGGEQGRVEAPNDAANTE